MFIGETKQSGLSVWVDGCFLPGPIETRQLWPFLMKRHGSQCLVGIVLLFENICWVLCQITTCEGAACFLSSLATVCSVICTLHGPVLGLSGEHSQLVSMNFLSGNRRGRSVAVKESVVRLRASTVTQITFNSCVWNYCHTRFATSPNLNSPAITMNINDINEY